MADAMEPSILYEDTGIIVLDKPAGLRVHPVRLGERGTLVDFMLARWPELKGVGEDPLRPGIVHRLDADTSGVIVVAKTDTVFEHLKRSFKSHAIEKKYLALVHGAMRERAGEINYPIGHGAHTATKRTARVSGREVRGEREAFTGWRLIKQYADPSTRLGASFAFLEVTPKTGRTHQIRVHMAAIGHPIAGDRLYGSRKLAAPPGLTRLFLHASYLAFSLPNGQRFALESDLPLNLAGILKSLKNEEENDDGLSKV
jgi:23S rRNA pseudouridine1911/1915/1917 synthase